MSEDRLVFHERKAETVILEPEPEEKAEKGRPKKEESPRTAAGETPALPKTEE